MTPSKVAIVGMAGRFPGAHNVREFWRNLRDGVESIRTLSDDELLNAGVPRTEFERADYVKRAATLDGVGDFDAGFFQMSPRDAAIMDPQHRHFLECAWEALEDAGHAPQNFSGSIGVFAGSGLNSYLIHNLLANRELLAEAGLFRLKQTGNDKDVLASRVSYQFDLRGPSISVQTACSTSLVAVHLACQSLLNGECDMALAGGVTIEIPHGQGYIYREGEILSRDGRCRPFDAASTGTVFASGVGVVVLRRLEDALADGDNIRAVVLGSAINNDGARKAGYLAPSVDGQAEVIAEALAIADVTADAISYVETHGTGTRAGDPIELRALTQAFRGTSNGIGYCAIGSLKSNVGHLDAAAGVAALIKTVMALEHEQLPPSLHFTQPNPHLALEGGPFFVNAALRTWPRGEKPRRAGVTALGIGGTNAHVVLEEAPLCQAARAASLATRPCHLFLISAKTDTAADRGVERLIAHVTARADISLGDASWTAQAGRHAFAHRRAFVLGDNRAAPRQAADFSSCVAAETPPRVAFLFSGQGQQYVGMARELYQHEPAFHDALDRCASILQEPLGLDLRTVLYSCPDDEAAAAAKLNEAWLAQPIVFAVEYALAAWWLALGVQPAAVGGHSLGEYVAACVAGVFSLEDALLLVAARGRMMNALPHGAMLAVALPADQLPLSGELSVAAINAPDQCVVSGPAAAIETLRQDLSMQSIACRRLAATHALHSAMMEPMLEAFEQRLRQVELHAPRVLMLSNLTGTWITAEQATDPRYWIRHLRETVLFCGCVAELLRDFRYVILEVGAGDTLAQLVRQQVDAATVALPSLPPEHERNGGLRRVLQSVGQLWTMGVEIDWARLHESESVRRMPLPTYAFDHAKYWIDADATVSAAELATAGTGADTGAAARSEAERGPHFYQRVWKPAALANDEQTPYADERACWLIFMDALGLGAAAVEILRASGHAVVMVKPGNRFARHDVGNYTVRPEARADYDALAKALLQDGRYPASILHLWSVFAQEDEVPLSEATERCFLSPLLLAQALGGYEEARIKIIVVSNRMQQVRDETVRQPERALLLGPVRVIPLELPHIHCRSVDVEGLLDFRGGDAHACAVELIAEARKTSVDTSVALRSGERFVEALESFTPGDVLGLNGVERGGVFLITGGLGGVGMAIALYLATQFAARLVLISRRAAGDDLEAESRHSIEAIRAAAGGLLLLQADVSDPEQMRGAVEFALQTFGGIDYVLHAAGVLDDAPLMTKTREASERVLLPKVRGTLVLEEALRGVKLRRVVLFSSISAIDPPAGQVDYAAANAFLDAFALSRGGAWMSINWGLWRGVGMGSISGAQHPLLGECLQNGAANMTYKTVVSPSAHWVLAEHALTIEGRATGLMPGTAYMEMAFAAFAGRPSSGAPGDAVEMRDVLFLRPLLESAQREMRVELMQEGNGAFNFTAFSRVGAWAEHCTGNIACIHSVPTLTRIDRAALIAHCTRGEQVFNEQHSTRQEKHLVFGPRWRSLHKLWLGDGELVAEIVLPDEFRGDLEVWHAHPALLDLATGAAFYLTMDYEQSEVLFLPISYRKITMMHPLPARLFSHARRRGQGAKQSEVESFDLTLFDEWGAVLVEIEGFSARRVAGGAPLREEDAHGRDRSPRFTPQAAGIDPVEGAQALVRILSMRALRSVIVLGAPLQANGTDAVFTEPDALKADGVPHAQQAVAQVGIQGTLVAWWQQMLGVEGVHEDDDFFDLGGHSLIAMRLLARVKKTFNVDMESSVLYEQRTIRQLTATILASVQAE